MRHFSHLNTSIHIIQEYRGKEPLHQFLKNFFGGDKKFGSKDRKRISQLCYSFYRVGLAFEHNLTGEDKTQVEKIILAALFLTRDQPDELLAATRSSWNDSIQMDIYEKAEILKNDDNAPGFNIRNIFPFQDELSDGVDQQAFSISHLLQPDLFIRSRPGYELYVRTRLEEYKVDFEFIPEFTIRLPNRYKVEELFVIDKEVVVQDLNSQRVGELMREALPASKGMGISEPSSEKKSVWDCCAASGGKSIMATDILGHIQLTVSDIRESIIANLKKRFANAGITGYKAIVADLSSNIVPATLRQNRFDTVIADLPCTGSGTWARTPEQLYFFDPSRIAKYSTLQKRILRNVVPSLRPGGQLHYITCSVFKEENEAIIEFLQKEFGLKLNRSELLKGYSTRADTMFTAVLSKS